MVDVGVKQGRVRKAAGASQRAWLWHPPLPLQAVPVFVWPPRPLAALKYFLSLAFMGSVILPFGALAVLVWTYLQPPLEVCAELQIGWILQVYGRNLLLMLLVAGGLHLYFHSFKGQGQEKKFDPREMAAGDRRYLFGSQVFDNMFWSCASGVTFWTAYEVLILWAYGNGFVPFYLDWSEHPVWFVATFLAIPFWASMHFYFIHRLLHWMPLYRLAHALHHRNENTGPWSGLSMHPIEHVIYFSSVLVHLLVMSHPIHVLFHNCWNALGAATSHTGFESLLFKGRPIFMLGSFHHQLHHRYYHCNYGNPPMPWDRWLGTDHDGTPEALERMRERQRRR